MMLERQALPCMAKVNRESHDSALFAHPSNPYIRCACNLGFLCACPLPQSPCGCLARLQTYSICLISNDLSKLCGDEVLDCEGKVWRRKAFLRHASTSILEENLDFGKAKRKIIYLRKSELSRKSSKSYIKAEKEEEMQWQHGNEMNERCGVN